jgi:serine O-acetyltransferase
MLKLILEDLKTQREGLLAQGFWALAVYRFSNARHRHKIPIIGFIWAMIGRVLGKFVEILTGITIPDYATIGRRLTIEHCGGIVLHGETVIGDDCVIRQGVTIGNRYSNRPMEAPVLGNGVEIGAGAKVLGAIRLGDGAAVGANAVVLTDVPPGAAAVGVPARIILPKAQTDRAE